MAARLDARRAALTLVRQHLLTARFDFYKIKEGGTGYQPVAAGNLPAASGTAGQVARQDGPVACSPQTQAGLIPNPALSFVCKTVPHIALRSIVQNVALDATFTKHRPILDAMLTAWRAKMDAAAFAALSGTVSLPFAAGPFNRCASCAFFGGVANRGE